MNNYVSYPGTKLGNNCQIGDYVILGLKPEKIKEEILTEIGNNSVIRSHTVIYYGNKIGNNFQTGHRVLIREKNQIGDNVSIGSGSNVEYSVIIEDGVRLHSNTFVPEYSILRKECWIGPNVVLTNARYPRSKNVKEMLEGVEIGEGAKIGANSTILPGIKIGKYALIGAGSVVTKDVPDNAVVCGNPAKIIKYLKDIEEYK